MSFQRHAPHCSQVAQPRGSAPESGTLRLHALREASAQALTPLLSEEARCWREELGWDYSDVISSILAGLHEGNVFGWAFFAEDRAAAYCYAVSEPSRVVVGSIFAASEFRNLDLETTLLECLLLEIVGAGVATRIECQTLFCTSPRVEEAFLRQGFRSRDRRYLIRDVASTSGDFNVSAGLRRIRNGDLERIGRLVYESHRGSADAALNVTYASAEGSLQFVDSIISRSGCGVFDTQASLVAEAHESLGGVILVTRISHDHAHVCQISVNPDRQRTGIGNALLSAALAALKRAGLQRVTLSVTEDNTSAKRLYERHGFRPRRAFASYAWVRPPGRIPLVP